MTSTDHLDLDAIEARANAAEDGWHVVFDNGTYRHEIHGDGPTHVAVFGGDPDDGFASYPVEANAEFAAHARTDVPALVAEVRRLRDRVAELESPVEAKPSPAPGICRCGHRQAAHDSGEPGCSACPSTGNWDHPYRPSAAAPAVVSAR